MKPRPFHSIRRLQHTISSSHEPPPHPSKTRTRAPPGTLPPRSMLYERGYWTVILPRANAKIVRDAGRYDKWFLTNFWYPQNGLKNWAKKYIVRSANSRTGLNRVAIEWPDYESLKSAYRFFNGSIEASASPSQLIPFQLIVDRTRWPLNSPLITQFKIRNLSGEHFNEEATFLDMKNRIIEQFPYLSQPVWDDVKVWKSLSPRKGDPSGWAASWTTSNEGVRQAIELGPVGEKEKATWQLQAEADGNLILKDLGETDEGGEERKSVMDFHEMGLDMKEWEEARNEKKAKAIEEARKRKHDKAMTNDLRKLFDRARLDLIPS
ncbi:hypothetical protein BT69DRAFT_1352685 [Atractiella rhizophila]|nr:hypothetical protein BT69DRAFT_1352685 [Atractiella rhizophila]